MGSKKLHHCYSNAVVVTFIQLNYQPRLYCSVRYFDGKILSYQFESDLKFTMQENKATFHSIMSKNGQCRFWLPHNAKMYVLIQRDTYR